MWVCHSNWGCQPHFILASSTVGKHALDEVSFPQNNSLPWDERITWMKNDLSLIFVSSGLKKVLMPSFQGKSFWNAFLSNWAYVRIRKPYISFYFSDICYILPYITNIRLLKSLPSLTFDALSMWIWIWGVWPVILSDPSGSPATPIQHCFCTSWQDWICEWIEGIHILVAFHCISMIREPGCERSWRGV